MSEIKLDILAHADFSGQLHKSKRYPGYGTFATQVEMLREKNPDGTIFLDAGDEFSTNFWGGVPMVKAVSLSGTDAMTLGNHEFDHGEENLTRCISAADFPILCSNIYVKSSGELIPNTTPWIILDKKGIKIGILGLTTEYTPKMVTQSSFEAYEAKSCIDAANKYIPLMRKNGAEIIMLLAHIPFYIDGKSVSGELVDILNEIPPVDVCIGGHIPGDFAGIVGNTLLLKGGFSGKSICHGEVFFDSEKRAIIRKSGEIILTDRNISPIEKYAEYEKEVTAPFWDFFDKALVNTDEKWEIHLSSETRLGNYFAQCVQEAAKCEIAYINATSCGGTIEPGIVTADDITSVMGFNDPLFKAEITGKQIWDLFELVYDPERFGNNASLLFSGLILYIDHTKSAYHKVLNITLTDGTPIEKDKIYTVATSEYMASGGSDTKKIADCLKWEKVGVKMYEAIFKSLEKYGEIHVSPEQRIHEIGRPENDNSPF